MRLGWWLVAGLIGIGVAPMLGLALRAGLLALGGCPAPDGFVQPCLIGGLDLGGVIQVLALGHWAFFLTAPLALAGIVLGIALALVTLMRRARE